MKYYHNPRCTKSREGLAYLEEKGIAPEVVLYMNEPISPTELEDIIDALDIEASDLIRKKEALFKELNLAAVQDDEQLIKAMVKHPILIERPIVVCAKQARVGRPLEQVLEII